MTAIWTPPKTWIPGETVEASEANAYIRDNMEYLKAVQDGLLFSGVRAGRSTNQSLSTGSATAVIFTATFFDLGDWWDAGTPTELVVPDSAIPAGFTKIACMISARGNFAANSTGKRKLAVLRNGGTIWSVRNSALDDGDDTEIGSADLVADVEAGDVFTLQATQTSGGNLNLTVAHLAVARYAPQE